MKYVDLKSKLKDGVDSNYLITGDDRFLCFDALKKIEEKLAIQFKDMNYVTLSGQGLLARDIVLSANIYPFGDEFRLVVIKSYNPDKNKEELKVLQEYLNEPLKSTILVFFSPDGADFAKNLKGITTIDCNKIDSKYIAGFIQNRLSKEGIKSSPEVIDKLIMYAGNDMARITSELEKLCVYVYEDKVLTSKIVEEFVVQDKEFQVYELADFLAKGDSKSAYDLVESMSYKSGSAFSLLPLLYNAFRRALFVAINKDKSSTELAELLSVKEFAIKMTKNQASNFSIKQLKQIVDMIADYDRKVKVGEMKENVAIKTLIFNILNIRGTKE